MLAVPVSQVVVDVTVSCEEGNGCVSPKTLCDKEFWELISIL